MGWQEDWTGRFHGKTPIYIVLDYVLLPPRAKKALQPYENWTVGEFRRAKDSYLKRTWGMGPKTLAILRDVLR